MTSVLFLCNTNRGKSQMAAALAKKHAPDWDIYSAGVQTTEQHREQGVNAEAQASLAKILVPICRERRRLSTNP